MKSRITFANPKIEKAWKDLKESKTEEKKLYKWISRAFDDLKENVFYGIQIPKNLIPKIYIDKYGIDNLWKYDLPQGWRLLYSVSNGQISVLSIVLEWMDHKSYERRFNY